MTFKIFPASVVVLVALNFSFKFKYDIGVDGPETKCNLSCSPEGKVVSNGLIDVIDTVLEGVEFLISELEVAVNISLSKLVVISVLARIELSSDTSVNRVVPEIEPVTSSDDGAVEAMSKDSIPANEILESGMVEDKAEGVVV